MSSSPQRIPFYSSAVCIAALLLGQASPLRAQVGFNQFAFGPLMDAVYAITAGPDDALWLVVYNGAGGYYEIGRMSLTGAVTSFPLPQYNEPPGNYFGSGRRASAGVYQVSGKGRVSHKTATASLTVE